MVKLSLIISTRNDDFYEDNLKRLSKTVNTNLYFLDKLGLISDVEFNIIDWGSKKPLSEDLRILKNFTNNVNFFHIDKDTADKNSEFYPNKFNLDIPPNIGVRVSKGEFIIQATSDQIFSRTSWYNLLNILNNENKFNFNLDNTILYVPRKIIEYDFYKKNPSIETLEEFLDHSNSSYMQVKNSNFFIGGGYSLLCKRKILYDVGGINSEKNNIGTGNDWDLNVRLKKLGIKQMDTSIFGVAFYKFPSSSISQRNKVLTSGKTRNAPSAPIKIFPNDENWGLKNYVFNTEKSKINIEDINSLNSNNFLISKNYFNKSNLMQLLGVLSKFNNINFDFREWLFTFNIIKIIGSTRIFSIVEFGFENVNRLNAIGQHFKSIEILSFDILTKKVIQNYLDRQPVVQSKLSRVRYGKFVPLISDDYQQFDNHINKMKLENFSNLFLVNTNLIENEEMSEKLKSTIIRMNNNISFIVFNNNRKKDNFDYSKIDSNFVKIKDNSFCKIFLNRNLLDQIKNKDEILFKIGNFKLLFLAVFYAFFSIYSTIAKNLKFLHKIIFKFKY